MTNKTNNEYEKLHQINLEQNQVRIQPFRCPVCNGNGIVPSGFYNQTSGYWTSSNTTEKCRSCDGKGIVWG